MTSCKQKNKGRPGERDSAVTRRFFRRRNINFAKAGGKILIKRRAAAIARSKLARSVSLPPQTSANFSRRISILVPQPGNRCSSGERLTNRRTFRSRKTVEKRLATWSIPPMTMKRPDRKWKSNTDVLSAGVSARRNFCLGARKHTRTARRLETVVYSGKINVGKRGTCFFLFFLAIFDDHTR